MKRTLIVLTVLLCLAAPAAAQFRPVGVPVPIEGTEVAMDAAGNFVVAWMTCDPMACRAHARLYDASGVPRGNSFVIGAGGEFLGMGDLTMAPQGHFVATFLDDSYGYGSRYEVFTAEGDWVAGGVLASDAPYRVVRTAQAAADAAGNFILVWNDRAGVHVQVIDRTGRVLVGPLQIAASRDEEVWSRAVFAEWAGNFTVLWSRGDDTGCRGRRYSASGELLGAAFDVECPWTSAGARNGDFVVAWTTEAPSSEELWARRYTANGVALGQPFQIDDAEPYDAWYGHGVAIDARGDITFAWTEWTGAGSHPRARRYRWDGTPYGPAFSIGPDPAVSWVQVFCEPVGHCLFTWRDEEGYGIHHAMRYRVQPREWPVKGDFSGDGRTDLVLRHSETGATRLWTMVDGARISSTAVWPPTPEIGHALVGVDDFDGDAHNDLLFRHDHTGALQFWCLGGVDGNEVLGMLPLYGASVPALEWSVVASGDFTFDGWPDLVWQNRATGQIRIWRMAGMLYTQTLVPAPDGPGDASWTVVAAQDFDGNGTRDLLFHHRVSGQLVQWLLDAGLTVTGGHFTSPAQASDMNWKVVASGDYGIGPGGVAGSSDILWRNESTGRQMIWYFDFAGNRTAGAFTAPMSPADPVWCPCGPR